MLDWEIVIQDEESLQAAQRLLEEEKRQRDHHHHQVMSAGGFIDSDPTVMDRHIAYLERLISMYPQLLQAGLLVRA